MRAGADLRGRVVVVTGASSGIGRGVALALARRGACVVATARDVGALDDVVRRCAGHDGSALAVLADVTEPEAMARVAREAVDRFGRLDAWVGAAGVIAYGEFLDIPADAFRQVIETNLLGVVNGARAALPHFRQQGAGTLVTVNSMWGRVTSPQVSAYVASKSGVRAFLECLGQELRGEDGIAVCSVYPGSVDTPIFRHAANYLGRRVRPVPPVSPAERVVRAVIRCLEHPGTRDVSIGHGTRLLLIGYTVLPRLYRRLGPRFYETLMSTPGRGTAVEPTAGNLFRPMPAWHQVDGGWRRRWAR